MLKSTANMSIIFFMALCLTGCGMDDANYGKTGYNLNNPDVIFTLPDTLHEISGLTYLDSTSFACIQDEKGIVFIYDFVKNKIKKQIPFHLDGDYEGITRVDKTLFVLRSDGTLFEIQDYQSNDPKADSICTGIKAKNNEGLCYDKDNNRLMIASKGKIGKGREFKNRRAVYSYDLGTMTLAEKLLYDIDLPTIKQFALDNNISLPAHTNKKKKTTEPNIKFNTSAIGIHPLTKKLFILSASDKLLFIFDKDGNMEHMQPLDKAMFNKAEGITFLENGDMLITNEGQDKKPTLLRFNYKVR